MPISVSNAVLDERHARDTRASPPEHWPGRLSVSTLGFVSAMPEEEISELLAGVLGGPVEVRTAGGLGRLADGDPPLLRELARAGRSTGALTEAPAGWRWQGDLPAADGLSGLLEQDALDGESVPSLALEAALAVAALLSEAGRAAEAETVLARATRSSDSDQAQAAYACARAANLAWGLGRADEADRLLSETADTITEVDSRQRVRAQRAAVDLHRARCREALDGVDDVRELGPPSPAVGAQIAVVTALAAALTGQATASLHTARKALRSAPAWAATVPECGPALEFAWASAWLSAGDLDAAEEPADPGWDGDAVAHAAVLARVSRERGKIRQALRLSGDGAGRLHSKTSLFAGPCLGELAHAAALTGELDAARAALAEAERRAVPALRALWFPVALARPWVLAAQGAVGAAVHDLLDAAAAAERLELRAYALFALHDVVRLGAAGVVADRLARLAEDVDGVLAPLCARHALAAAAVDPAELMAVSVEFEGLGMILHAAEAAAQAGEAHWDKQYAAAAGSRAWVLAQRCDHVRTPALRTAAVPDLTRIQYEIAELVAAGRTEREIAEAMDIPARMVGEQLVEVCVRLGVTGQDELAILLAP
jgi:DNA-binding CsgD family transcriptional regulator